MKFVVIAALFTAASVSARPAVAIDTSRQFDCPSRVNDYCHAPNIHGGCSFAGSFSSSDPNTCGGCSCF